MSVERELDLRCVASSPPTETAALAPGMRVESFRGVSAPTRLDIRIDGADQVAASGWLVKGGGGARTREKALAAASDRFVVIVSSAKLVEALTPPVPLELRQFGLAYVSDVIIARGERIEHRRGEHARQATQ